MYEEERAERDFRQNPPEYAPGQGEGNSADDWDSFELGSSSAESIPSSVDNIGSNQQNQQQQQQQQNSQDAMKAMTTTEDKIIDLTVEAGKGVYKYVKYLIMSLSNNTSNDWHMLGVRVCLISAICFGVGLLFTLVSVFAENTNQPLDLVIGSLISMIVGVGLCMFFDRDKESINKEEDNNEEEEQSVEDMWSNWDNNDLFEDIPEDSLEEEVYSDDTDEELDSDSDVWGSLLEDEEEDSLIVSESIEDTSVEEALENVPEITQGTQTRRFLYETFLKVLPLFTPDFADMKEITQDEDDFYFFEGLVRDAAYQVGTKEENIPELETVYENDFIYRLTCTRPVGLKEQLIADEVASSYSRDDKNMEVRVGVYATVETSTGMFSINLFKGNAKENAGKSSVRISLGDIYRNIESFMCDTRNVMPFVWGVNEFGKPIYCDILGMNSLIISGEPRGGKSWKGQSILAQLCMFNSPKEVEFYIFDGKNTASDYRYPAEVLPHIKYFCGDPARINDGIEKVIKKATTERDRILNDAGCINIKDYNEKNPSNKLSYMYVVVDEMMSLMEYFNLNDMKDESNRFKGFLSTMVSKLAYTGVRFILFPHRIVDSVISKNTYSLVSTRAVVCQSNPDDLKSSMDVTSKTFPYSLVSPGDMAIRSKDVEGGKVIFCHAEMLTSNNDTNKKLFEFIGSVWKRLEPECQCIEVKGSVCGKITIEGTEEAIRQARPARDNTVGSETYQYKGYSVEDLDLNLSDEEEEVDESFWGTF